MVHEHKKMYLESGCRTQSEGKVELSDASISEAISERTIAWFIWMKIVYNLCAQRGVVVNPFCRNRLVASAWGRKAWRGF